MGRINYKKNEHAGVLMLYMTVDLEKNCVSAAMHQCDPHKDGAGSRGFPFIEADIKSAASAKDYVYGKRREVLFTMEVEGFSAPVYMDVSEAKFLFQTIAKEIEVYEKIISKGDKIDAAIN